MASGEAEILGEQLVMTAKLSWECDPLTPCAAAPAPCFHLYQVVAVPLDCAVISRFISTTDEPMALGAFTVRAASDLNKAVNLRPRMCLL